MRSSAIKIRENFTIKVVLKLFNKELLEVATVISSHRCSVEVEGEEREVHKKVKMFNMPLKLLSKKFIEVKLQKLLLIEIESVRHVVAKVEQTELNQLALVAEEEV